MSVLDDKDFAIRAPYIQKILELEQRVKVLTDAIHLAQIASCSCMTKTNDISYHSEHCLYRILGEALNQTPQQTAAQIERWHIEWMMRLPVAARIDRFGFPKHVSITQTATDWHINNEEDWSPLVAIPPLPNEKP